MGVWRGMVEEAMTLVVVLCRWKDTRLKSCAPEEQRTGMSTFLCQMGGIAGSIRPIDGRGFGGEGW